MKGKAPLTFAALHAVMAASIAMQSFAQGRATIQGRATNGDKPVAALEIILKRVAGQSVRIGSTTSDANGRFHFDAIEPGEYEVLTESPLFVTPGKWAGIGAVRVAIRASDRTVKIELPLVEGAVVKGTVKDADGNAWSNQYIQLDRLDDANDVIFDDSADRGRYLTNENGAYVAAGVPPGRYRVSSGQGVGSISPTSEKGKSGRRTFHPEIAVVSEATIIELVAGEELRNIDIRMLPPLKFFSISGRVTDAQTGKAMTDVAVAYGPLIRDQVMAETNQDMVRPNGEFRFDEVRAGSYGVYLLSPYSSSLFADTLRADVVDEDVRGLELIVRPGSASLSGQVIVEGMGSAELMRGLRVFVTLRRERGTARKYDARLDADGNFHVNGIVPGVASIEIEGEAGCEGGLSRVGTERDGQGLGSTFEIRDGESVTGVRAIFACGLGRIQGHILAGGEKLPSGATFYIMPVHRTSTGNVFRRSVFSDESGNFVIAGLLPGEYQLEVHLSSRGAAAALSVDRSGATQAVTVVNGKTSEVTFKVQIKK